MSATIKDVARLAGCSIKTVSRVINQEPYVSRELRQRVQTAIRTIGYAPNISARRLARNKTNMLCVLMYPGFHQTASNILPRLMHLGYEQNYDILIQPYFPTLTPSRNKLVALVSERRFDGFVSTPPCDADGFIADLLVTYKVPLVQINPLTSPRNTPFVAGEDFKGAGEITRHLLTLGHRRVAFLMGARNMRSSFDRLKGYQEALEQFQIPLDERLIENTESNFDGGCTATKLLMERSPKPTAIFASNDEAAFGALFAVQELGLRIPEQISVCGFDDLPLSKHIWPGLTTVHQPAEEMLARAVQMLIDILQGFEVDTSELILPSRLVIRGSTAPPSPVIE